MLIKEIRAIDVHCHYGHYNSSNNMTEHELMSADIDGVLKYQGAANIGCSIISPFKAMEIDNGGDPILGNEQTSVLVDNTKEIYQWVVIHPDIPETFRQAEKRLKSQKCVGIKIHPEMHRYNIKEKGDTIFAFAALHKTVVLTHSGEERSKPEDFVEFANNYPEMRLILAHLGCSYDDDPFHHAYAIQKCKYDNVYTDTSSATQIMPRLLEMAVKMIGADKILFGSDVPAHFSSVLRARIDNAFISERDKIKILSENAVNLFEKINRDYNKIYAY